MSGYLHWLGEYADKPQRAPDHALAASEMLRRFADRLEAGESGFDMGEELVLAARIIARRT